MSASNSALCAFCGKHPPIAKSHVIPAFFIRRMKKATKGPLWAFNRNPRFIDSTPVQDTFYEPLLCEACERKFQRWDDYMADVFYTRRLFNVPPATSVLGSHIVSGLDYKMFKLGLISMAWRIAEAKYAPFHIIQPKRAYVRAMWGHLFREDPGLPEENGCALMVPYRLPLKSTATTLRDPYSVAPLLKEEDGNPLQVLWMVLDGIRFEWAFGKAPAKSRKWHAQFYVQPSGIQRLYVQEISKMPDYAAILNEVGASDELERVRTRPKR